MSRKREIVVNQNEDIVSYEHNLVGRFVRVLVGTGTVTVAGEFVPAENQNFENIIIQDGQYDDLMAAKNGKPDGVFRKSDLWAYIDSERSAVIAKAGK